MSDYISTPQAITPHWLTKCLVESGHLLYGEVRSIALGKTINTKASTATSLTVTYTSDATESTPSGFLFKSTRPENYWGLAAEVFFYNEIASKVDNLAVPDHYYAFAEHDQKVCALLQQDVSSSHELLTNPLQANRPTPQEWQHVIDEMVKLHAHWWNHPFIEECLVHEQGGPLVMAHAAKPEVIHSYGQQMVEYFPKVASKWGDALPSKWHMVCKRAIEVWPKLLSERINSGLGLTMIHGDFHIWNIFFPKIEKADSSISARRPLIIDWETFKRGIGPYDLAYLLIDSGQRKHKEALLLKHYHAKLLDAGISGYTWEDCKTDYRLSIIACLFPPLKWQRIEPLASVMEAFEAWSCQELL